MRRPLNAFLFHARLIVAFFLKFRALTAVVYDDNSFMVRSRRLLNDRDNTKNTRLRVSLRDFTTKSIEPGVIFYQYIFDTRL